MKLEFWVLSAGVQFLKRRMQRELADLVGEGQIVAVGKGRIVPTAGESTVSGTIPPAKEAGNTP